MTRTVLTAQQIFDRSVELGIAPVVGLVVEALRSPDPLASLTWLASVEQDPQARFAFAKAAELVRARDGGGRD